MTTLSSASRPLWDPTLLPTSSIPSQPDLILRPLQRNDHAHGHLAVLNVLSPTPEMTAEGYEKVWDEMERREGTYYPLVIFSPPTSRILASATLLLERKLLRAGSLVGHIEDVAVHPSAQGLGLGKVLVVTLAQMAERLGCYKCILDCEEGNVGFYERCGFWRKEVEMVQYFGAARIGKEPPPKSGAPKPKPKPETAKEGEGKPNL